ncbi:MAG: UbiD family decarboxylase, partial [Alphaproteobacteria bacterium]
MATAYASLREFMALLEERGLLARVSHPVSSELELTEIQTRLLAEGGPAVLFENVTTAGGAPAAMPALINLFGTVE